MKIKILLPIALVLMALAVYQLIINNNEFGNNENNTFQPPERKYKTIAIVVHDMRHLFMSNVAGMLREKARENENIRILLYDSESSNEKQISQLNELIEKKVDGIVLNPTHKTAINESVKKIKNAGIPLVTINMNTTGDGVDCYIGSDPFQAGTMQGDYAAKQLGGAGNLAVLAGRPEHAPTGEMLKGLESVLKNYPGMQMVYLEYGNWDRSRGAELMEKIISSGTRIDAVISQNDEMLLGAVQTLEKHRQKPLTIGVDAIPEALETMLEGRMDATVRQNGKAQASAAFEVMSRLFNNEQVEKTRLIPLELVTPENVDKYTFSDIIKK